jgi:hypothetical protein
LPRPGAAASAAARPGGRTSRRLAVVGRICHLGIPLSRFAWPEYWWAAISISSGELPITREAAHRGATCGALQTHAHQAGACYCVARSTCGHGRRSTNRREAECADHPAPIGEIRLGLETGRIARVVTVCGAADKPMQQPILAACAGRDGQARHQGQRTVRRDEHHAPDALPSCRPERPSPARWREATRPNTNTLGYRFHPLKLGLTFC